MAIANLGSIATRVINRVGSIPVSISGTELLAMINDRVIFIEQFTGQTIGSVAIAEMYQPALLSFSIADTLRAIDSQQGNVNDYTLGDLRIKKGFGADSLAQSFEDDGTTKMKRLGRQFKVYKAYG
jgi:hypothetical protein